MTIENILSGILTGSGITIMIICSIIGIRILIDKYCYKKEELNDNTTNI
jgi:hypothetical protein